MDNNDVLTAEERASLEKVFSHEVADSTVAKLLRLYDAALARAEAAEKAKSRLLWHDNGTEARLAELERMWDDCNEGRNALSATIAEAVAELECANGSSDKDAVAIIRALAILKGTRT